MNIVACLFHLYMVQFESNGEKMLQHERHDTTVESADFWRWDFDF